MMRPASPVRRSCCGRDDWSPSAPRPSTALAPMRPDARAVARVFEAKGRPHFNPLICHYPDAQSAFADVAANDMARALACAFWPGALTLVLPRRVTCRVALLAGAGLDTLAVRVPAGATARALLQATGRPVAAPSANRSGQVSPTTAAHVLDGLDGRIAAVLDSGPCPIGVESTVLDLSGASPFLLRPGGVPAEAIAALTGPLRQGITPAQAEATRTLRSPGLMVSHYAPALPVRLDATGVGADEALLAFGPPLPGAGATFQLSEAGDTDGGGGQSVRRLARARCSRRARRPACGSPSMPVPHAQTRPRHQRSAAARRRAEGVRTTCCHRLRGFRRIAAGTIRRFAGAAFLGMVTPCLFPPGYRCCSACSRRWAPSPPTCICRHSPPSRSRWAGGPGRRRSPSPRGSRVWRSARSPRGRCRTGSAGAAR